MDENEIIVVGENDYKVYEGENANKIIEKAIEREKEIIVHELRQDEFILGFRIDDIYPIEGKPEKRYGDDIKVEELTGDDRYRFLNLWRCWFRAKDLKYYMIKTVYVCGLANNISAAAKIFGVDLGDNPDKHTLGKMATREKWRLMRKRLLTLNGGKKIDDINKILFIYYSFIIRDLFGLEYNTMEYFISEVNYGFSIFFRHQGVELTDEIVKKIEQETKEAEAKKLVGVDDLERKRIEVFKAIGDRLAKYDEKFALAQAQKDYFNLLEIARNMLIDILNAKDKEEAEALKHKVQSLTMLAEMYRDILRIPPAPKPEQFSPKKIKNALELKPLDI